MKKEEDEEEVFAIVKFGFNSENMPIDYVWSVS